MTEDKKHLLDELIVSDMLSYLGSRVSSMEEHIRRGKERLTEAKELLKRWVDDKVYTVSEQKDLIADTEQFLREAEND